MGLSKKMVFSEGNIDEVLDVLEKEIAVPRDQIHYDTITYKKHEHHIFYNGGNAVYTYFAIQDGKNSIDEFYLGIMLHHMDQKQASLTFVDDHVSYKMGSMEPQELKDIEERLLDGKQHRVVIGLQGQNPEQKEELCGMLYELSLMLRDDIGNGFGPINQ